MVKKHKEVGEFVNKVVAAALRPSKEERKEVMSIETEWHSVKTGKENLRKED